MPGSSRVKKGGGRKKKAPHSSNAAGQKEKDNSVEEMKVGRYDEKHNTKVTIRGNNHGEIVVHPPVASNNNAEEIQREHRAEMEAVGKVSSIESERILIRTYVNNTLWKKKKFIASSQELDYKQRMCIRILTDLRVGKADSKQFWIRNRTHVFKCLGIKRNNVIGSLKQNFLSK
jgi:hypothetical protein